MKRVFACFLFFFAFPAIFSWTSREEKEKRVFEMVEDSTEIISAKTIKMELFKNTALYKAVQGEDAENLLMVALKTDKDFEIIEILLDSGIDVDYKTKSGKTALMYACRHTSDIKIVEAVLKNSSFFNSKRKKRILAEDKNGKTAYDYAAQNGMPGMKEEIFALFAPLVPLPAHLEKTPSPEPVSEIEKSNKKNKKSKSKKKDNIIEENPQKEEISDSAKTAENPQKEKEESKSEEIAENPKDEPKPEETAENKSEIDESNLAKEINSLKGSEIKKKKSPFLYDYAIENALIPAEDDDSERNFITDGVNLRDSLGRTPLMKAAKDGKISQIKDLLYSGAIIDATDGDGWTALMFAARYQKNAEIARTLLENGADFKKKNKFGVSALMIAAAFNPEKSVVKQLLSNRKAEELDVRLAFMNAVQAGAKNDILEEFLKKGISLNTPLNGKTALMLAAESNSNTETIFWLLTNGAKKNAVSGEGLTAFDYANANSKLPRDKVFWSLSPNQE